MRTLLLLLALAAPARAGLYFGDERPPLPRPETIREDVLQLRAIPIEPKGRLDPDSPRNLLQIRARRLEAAREEDAFSTADRVSLSACYLRLGRIDDAIRLLEHGDRTHFLVLANLATAYFMSGDYVRAVNFQDELLRAWPAAYAPWRAEDLARCRACEVAFKRVLEHRAREARRAAGGPAGSDPPGMDPIFPGFTVETPDRDYDPGDPPLAALDRLPANGLDVVMHLARWTPQDGRLYWQLGEVLAALGRVEAGAKILNELVDAGENFKGLRGHRRALREAAEAFRALAPPPASYQLLGVGLLLNGTPPAGASGHVLAASALFAPLNVSRFRPEGAAAPPPPQPEQVEVKPDTQLVLFNWQHIALSFAFGFLVAALVGFQLQEWQRRAARPGDVPPAASPGDTRITPPGL